jgi:hypothetical protein
MTLSLGASTQSAAATRCGWSGVWRSARGEARPDGRGDRRWRRAIDGVEKLDLSCAFARDPRTRNLGVETPSEGAKRARAAGLAICEAVDALSNEELDGTI